MTAWIRRLTCISLSLMCFLSCVGYAAVSENMSVSGSIEAEVPQYDVYISDVTPKAGAGVEIESTVGTLMTAKISGGGSVTFTVTVKNVSSQIYLYERTLDGKEVDIEGVYSGDEIAYWVEYISPMDVLSPNGGTRTFCVTLDVPEGVSTDCYILKFNFIERFTTPGEEEFPEDMPDSAVDLAQRIYDVLNNKYSVPNATKSARDYLLDDTINEYWDQWAPHYVGSMDERYEEQFDALFGDLKFDPNMKFILKEQNLIGDWVNEVAIYSTYDELDSIAPWGGQGVVCVYATVFTAVYDEWWNIVGYEMVAQSVRGYCYEVMYNEDHKIPSFSTDEWKTDVGYIDRWEGDVAIKYTIPDDTLNEKGELYKYDFDSYNLYYGDKYTAPVGQTISEWLTANMQ